MALEQVIYNLEEVKGLSDEELYQRLYDSWGLENHKIDVWGELSINEAGTGLVSVTQKLLVATKA